jgi:SAM-dependent methyltransferase
MRSDLLSKFYEDYHEGRRKRGTVSSSERIDFIVNEIGTGHEVVELGCRFGGLLKYFVQGNRVTGVDIDRRALEECARLYPVTTQLANLNDSLPFPDASFDIVVLSEVLEHLPYPGISLAEAARICRSSGKLLGSVPNAVRLKNRLRFLFGGPVDTDETHLHHFSVDSLIRLLSNYFHDVKAQAVSGRYVLLSRTLFANHIVFSAQRPRLHGSA